MAGPDFPSCQPLPQLPTGGYDDDYFVDPAPKSLHCPVCLLVLREPHLISCCGAHICQVCIESIQSNELSCPCCRSQNYINVLNKEKRGKVLELNIRCINSAKGCEWVGELGDHDRHCSSTCQYEEAVCQYGCGGSYSRFMLNKHEQDECPERPIDMKMATFTRQMMEKVSSLETKYEREIIALKQKLEDQEERHIMEKKELQRNYEEGKKEMLHEFKVQTKEMKKNTKTDKEQIVQIMKKEQERLTQQAEEMKKKAEADKKQIQIIKKEQEKCEAERRELANKLEKQREEYELEKREMKTMKKEDKEDLQHQFDMLQKITEKDKKEVLLQLAEHNNCDKDMREKLIALQRSAETLKYQVEQCENGRKALEKKLENEKQQIQERQRVQQQLTDQYEAEVVAFKMEQLQEILQLKKEISHIQVVSNMSPDVLMLMSKLRQIPDLVYHPEEGRVEVTAATQEEREKCISIFQQAYQQIVNNRQLKSESLELSQPYPPEQMEKVLQEFNEKYHQCYFSYNSTSHSIKIVSMSSRQYDQAKKLIKEKLSRKLPTSSTLDMGKTQVLQLPNGRTLSVKRGDIAEEKADILVNEANSHLDHIAGVAGALDKASNGELQKHCNVYHRQYGDVPAGEVAVTKAGGKLKCKHVIHAVGPIASIHKSDMMCSQLIFDAITNSLKKAQLLKATSIAFPALSTGVYAVKREIAAHAIFEAVCTFKYTSDSMKDIRIVILDEPTYSCFALMLLQRGSVQEVDGLDKKPIRKPVYTRSLSDETSYTGHSNTTTSEGGAFHVSDLNNQPNTMSLNIQSTAPPSLNLNPSPPQHVVTIQPSRCMPDIIWPELPSSITTGSTWDSHGRTLPPLSSSPNNPIGTGGSGLTQQGSTQMSTNDKEPFLKPSTYSPSQSPLTVTSAVELLRPQDMTKNKSTSHMTVSSSSGAVTKTTMTTSTMPTPVQNPGAVNNPTNTISDKQGCPICLNEVLTDPVTTNCCKNQFCRACIDQGIIHSPYCPICKMPLRKVVGNQPLGGAMNHYVYSNPLPGYPKCGTITITYQIPSGTQGPEHPNPGRHYHGTSRTAYLPDNPEGREVLKLLQKAFQARLIFTVGTSTISGRSNTVVWNDIHHKTNTHGGSSAYGYPDPTYLQRVKEELNAKGIH